MEAEGLEVKADLCYIVSLKPAWDSFETLSLQQQQKQKQGKKKAGIPYLRYLALDHMHMHNVRSTEEGTPV